MGRCREIFGAFALGKKLKTVIQNLQTQEGHLTIEGRTLYAEAMHLDKVSELPIALFDHINDCFQCSSEILEAYSLIQAEDIEEPHPFFSKSSEVDMVLEEYLQNIIREALSEHTTLNVRLENRMLQTLKSAPQMQFLQPQKDEVFIEKIIFRLKEAHSKNIRLMLQNADEEVVMRTSIPARTTQYILNCADYPDGLYYWTALLGNQTLMNRLYLCSQNSANALINQD